MKNNFIAMKSFFHNSFLKNPVTAAETAPKHQTETLTLRGGSPLAVC